MKPAEIVAALSDRDLGAIVEAVLTWRTYSLLDDSHPAFQKLLADIKDFFGPHAELPRIVEDFTLREAARRFVKTLS